MLKAFRHVLGGARAERWNRTQGGVRLELPSVPRLTILPLVEFEAGRPGLQTEPGVSYWVDDGESPVLFDLGYNREQTEPSPLLHNAELLGVDLTRAAAVVISHAHQDHCGGPRVAEAGEAWSTASRAPLGAGPAYAPVPLLVDGQQAVVCRAPRLVTAALAATGTLAGHAYHAGLIEEQSLLAHVAGKGLVLISGCGHPGVVEMARTSAEMTGLPLFAVVGGLHLYLGASNAGPLAGLSSRRFFGLPETTRRLTGAVSALLDLGLKEAHISPHDSSPQAFALFSRLFGERFHPVQAGVPIHL